MEIKILKKLEGAKQAEGLTVIIDVFRAFSAECFMYEHGAQSILAVGSVEDCFKLKNENPLYCLCGERGGRKVDGFDIGNSPSAIVKTDILRGKTVVHSTSAGVQGIVNAANASEIITGSLVNAKAIVKYIKDKNPDTVSLVCMGLGGKEETQEDNLCAMYIENLLKGKEINIHNEIADLRNTSGNKFFHTENAEIFPEADFFMCLVPDIFDFVIKAVERNGTIEMEKIDV